MSSELLAAMLVTMKRSSAKLLMAAALTAGLIAALPGAAQASFPGRDGRIVFASNRGGLYDLYLMTPRGRLLKRLTHTRVVHELSAAWSPDGRHIAYVRRSFADENHPGPFEIWLMNADGRRAHRIARGTDPAWAPDGRRIAFTGAYTPRASRPDIWVMRSDGSHKRRLTVNRRASDRRPDWSPDGRLIAYVSNFAGFTTGTRAIWTMRPDGSDKRRLTPLGARTDSPSWSPDGKRIAFVRWPSFGPAFASGLWTMSRDGSHEQPLGDTLAAACAWAPDGKSIVLATPQGVGNDIATIGLDGSSLVNLTHNPADDTAPAWQPRPRGRR
jgi:Tol biopolymer transport system component